MTQKNNQLIIYQGAPPIFHIIGRRDPHHPFLKACLIVKLRVRVRVKVKVKVKSNKHCEVLVSCSDWGTWIDIIELHA